jgi:hypothetical protein
MDKNYAVTVYVDDGPRTIRERMMVAVYAVSGQEVRLHDSVKTGTFF